MGVISFLAKLGTFSKAQAGVCGRPVWVVAINVIGQLIVGSWGIFQTIWFFLLHGGGGGESGFGLDCAKETVNMNGVKRILMVVLAVGMAWLSAGAVAALEEPAQACPVRKVVVTEFPTHNKLMMHPSPESHYTVFGSATAMFDPAKRRGIRVAVMWENCMGGLLRDVTLRLEYQQAKTRAFRTVDVQFPEVPAKKGRWTNFDLSGGEYEDTVHVAAWRVTVLGGGRVLGSKQASMWSTR